MRAALGASLLAVLVVLGDVAVAQNPPAGGALEVVRLQPNFYMIAGAGSNIGVQIGPEGVVLVDAGTAQLADAVVAAVKRLTDQPIRYIINTSADADHVAGNEKIARAGRSLFGAAAGGGAVAGGTAANNDGAASIVAAEPVLNRMSAPTGRVSPFATALWPTETYNQRRKYMYLNGEGIEVLHQPAAHTDGDSVVFFRRSDVVAAGDILDTTRFPVIDLARGGSIQGEIDALNRLIDLAIPSIPLVSQEGGTYVVPGHGYLCDQLDVVEYRDMVVIIRDRIQAMIEKGMTLDQVRTARPTFEYEPRWGAQTGFWTTAMFVEAVYNSLKEDKRPLSLGERR